MSKSYRLPEYDTAHLADDETDAIAAEIVDRMHALGAARGYDDPAVCDLDNMATAVRFAL